MSLNTLTLFPVTDLRGAHVYGKPFQLMLQKKRPSVGYMFYSNPRVECIYDLCNVTGEDLLGYVNNVGHNPNSEVSFVEVAFLFTCIGGES